MHRQTGLTVLFFSFLGSDSLHNDGHTARALMRNRTLFWKAVPALGHGLAHAIKPPNEGNEVDSKRQER